MRRALYPLLPAFNPGVPLFYQNVPPSSAGFSTLYAFPVALSPAERTTRIIHRVATPSVGHVVLYYFGNEDLRGAPRFTRLTPQTMYSQTPPNEPFTGGFRVDAPGPPPLPQAFLPPPALAYPAAPVAPYGFRLPTPAGPATLSPSPLNPIHTSMASTNSSTTFWPPHLNEGPRAHLNPVRPEVAHPPSSSPQVTVASHPGLYGPRHSNVSTPANPDHVSSNSFNSTSSEHPTILPQGQQDVASPPALSQPNEDFQYSTCTGKRKGLCVRFAFDYLVGNDDEKIA